LTATALDNTSILLQFPAASDIANAAGYIILRNVGSTPGTGALVDGNAPSGPNVITISDPTDTDYTVSGLNPNTDYHFIIIPYNRGGDDETYNYYTAPGYPSANATTEADVDVDANDNGVVGTGSPLDSGTP